MNHCATLSALPVKLAKSYIDLITLIGVCAAIIDSGIRLNNSALCKLIKDNHNSPRCIIYTQILFVANGNSIEAARSGDTGSRY